MTNKITVNNSVFEVPEWIDENVMKSEINSKSSKNSGGEMFSYMISCKFGFEEFGSKFYKIQFLIPYGEVIELANPVFSAYLYEPMKFDFTDDGIVISGSFSQYVRDSYSTAFSAPVSEIENLVEFFDIDSDDDYSEDFSSADIIRMFEEDLAFTGNLGEYLDDFTDDGYGQYKYFSRNGEDWIFVLALGED